MKQNLFIFNIILLVLFLGKQAEAKSTQEPSHRYLLHTDANITRLKNQIETDEVVRVSWENVLERAEQLSSKEHPGAADCQELGLAYRMTGESRFAEAIKKILVDYTKKETWEGRELLNRSPAWKGGLNTSHTSFYIALGYDCAYEFLTPSERTEIANGIVRVGINPLRNDWLNPQTNFHTFDTMGHNWWSACVYMAGFASLAVQNEFPEALNWVDEIAETITEWIGYSGSVLQNKIPNFDRNGGFYESINYASYGFSQYLLFRYACMNALPEMKQPEVPMMEKMADFFIQTTYYSSEGPLSVNFGDSSVKRNGNACLVLLWNMGYQNNRTAWYLKQTNRGSDKEGITSGTPNGLILNPDLPNLKKDFVPDLSNSQLYADMAWATMRNSWRNDETFIAVKSGLAWNHAHADAGSYILYHKGKNLIIDSGNSSYGNQLYTQYYCQSEAHNVVLWNGKGEERNSPYFGSVNHGSLHNLVEAGDFKYLLANATGPYSRILSRNYRSFLWVGDVILIIDDLLAYEPGQFEWLLHYNGESKRRGFDLSIKDGDAEVLVRPLYPETFPNGGLPHDFPEKMRMEERWGYEDHHPENKVPYWSISHFEESDRTKFVTAIILKDDENENELPIIERFDGKDFLGVRITQKGKTTEVYFNLLADGRIKHRNSTINMNGWETDAYQLALTFNEGADRSKIENIEDVFITHGSYLRRDNQVVIHALSKFTAYVEHIQNNAKIIFQGQANAKTRIYTPRKKESVLVNDSTFKGVYNSNSKTISFNLE